MLEGISVWLGGEWGIVIESYPVRRPGCLRPGPKLFVGERAHQSFGVKHGFVLEHEIDGAGQFDGQDGVGFEFVVVHFGEEPVGQWADEFVIAFGNDRRFAEGPAQIGIAQFGAAQALDLAGRSDGAFDQAAIGQEILDGGEAGDVADLVKQGGAQVLADAGHGLQERVIATGHFLGEPLELGFQGDDSFVEMADQSQFIFQGELADRMVFMGQELLLPGVAIVAVAPGESGPVVSQLMRLEAGQQIGAAPDEEGALAQQCAQGT